MPSSPSFAERLRALLGSRNLNALDLARKLRVAPRTMTNWTSGKTQPRATDIRRICDELDVSADHLIGRVDAECGLVPGSWIVDLDEYDRPTGKAEMSSEVPARPAIVNRKRVPAHRDRDRRRRSGLIIVDMASGAKWQVDEAPLSVQLVPATAQRPPIWRRSDYEADSAREPSRPR